MTTVRGAPSFQARPVPSEEEAAAIAAALVHLLEEEAAARAAAMAAPLALSPWVADARARRGSRPFRRFPRSRLGSP
jgi:hypothetical protein